FQRSIWAAILLALSFFFCQPDHALAQVTGSGTTGNIPKWTATSALGDSVITESSGNVGIGTTSPASPAGFAKVVHLRDSSSASYVADVGGIYRNEFGVSSLGGWVGTFDSIPLRLVTASTEKMRIDSSGNVGIGTIGI